jgi:hypothetical protein
MGIYYNSETLIASVQRRINIPLNQNTFTDADILNFADEELALSIVPSILSLHENYLLYEQITQLAMNQNEYLIPYRAIGNKLYDLQFVDQQHNYLPMSQTTWSDEPNYNGAYTTNLIYAYYVRNNRIGLLPTFEGLQTGMGALRFMYYIRPSSLVPSANVCVISNIDLVSGTITFDNIPTNPTYSTSTPVDFYQFNSPHSILNIDVLPLSVSTTNNTMTFNVGNTITTLSPGLAVDAFPGGYILISSTNNNQQYYLWFNNVWNGTSYVSAPNPSDNFDTIGRTGIEVDLTGVITAYEISLAIQAVLPSPEFTSTLNGTSLVITTGPGAGTSVGSAPWGDDTFNLSYIVTPSDIPHFLAVGDHVALAEQCCIPQIPSDLHVYLAQKTAERILESQGDAQGLALAQQKSKEMEFRAGTIIDNRVDESPPKLVNRHGILRSGLIQRLYRRRG